MRSVPLVIHFFIAQYSKKVFHQTLREHLATWSSVKWVLSRHVKMAVNLPWNIGSQFTLTYWPTSIKSWKWKWKLRGSYWLRFVRVKLYPHSEGRIVAVSERANTTEVSATIVLLSVPTYLNAKILKGKVIFRFCSSRWHVLSKTAREKRRWSNNPVATYSFKKRDVIHRVNISDKMILRFADTFWMIFADSFEKLNDRILIGFL